MQSARHSYHDDVCTSNACLLGPARGGTPDAMVGKWIAKELDVVVAHDGFDPIAGMAAT